MIGAPNTAKAAKALARTARFLEWSERLAAVGIWEWSPDSGQIIVSDNVCPLLGLPAEREPSLEYLMKPFDADGQAMLGAALHRAAEGGQGWDTELQLADGRTLRVMGGCEGQSPALRVLVALQDISERVSARAELENALARLELATRSGRNSVRRIAQIEPLVTARTWALRTSPSRKPSSPNTSPLRRIATACASPCASGTATRTPPSSST